MINTTEQPKTGLDALAELHAQARALITNCEAAGFRGPTVIDLVKGAQDSIQIEALKASQDTQAAAPIFHSREAALAYSALKNSQR